jgi:hypothetical protein
MKKNKKFYILPLVLSVIFMALILIVLNLIFLDKSAEETESHGNSKYFLHEDITATVFWIGEPASQDNEFISNEESAWDDLWKAHYGGLDSPYRREGYFPEGFIPEENPFYIALPYNDFSEDGERKESAGLIPWKNEKYFSSEESMLKNRWVKIKYGGKTAYAQWEDVGPFEEDDFDYVFGNNAPKNRINNNAGIDASPAVRDYLGLDNEGEGNEKVSWQFVDFQNVEEGPWKNIITTSPVYWE